MAQPPILSLEGIALQQGGKWLFGGPDHDPLDLHIGPRDRIALIGRNGVGKTTLFRMIDGQVETDAGIRKTCLLYTSPSPRDRSLSRMPSSA